VTEGAIDFGHLDPDAADFRNAGGGSRYRARKSFQGPETTALDKVLRLREQDAVIGGF
jgi:hypothetical protein